ncbi:MAG: glycoside hydrolase family 2 [Ruminococcaceae bacterium]|nr:glycoside hydrolase family 2 [Oscillospiraceae bacterium]
MQLKTRYVLGDIPHSEHPTPQSRRDTWLTLNGIWYFEKQSVTETFYAGEILVPFSPETANSGIPEGFLLQAWENLYYRRAVTLSEQQISGRTVLHFGAVDSECRVLWNGTEVGSHRDGFTAFSFDITALVQAGENLVEVYVTDEATRNGDARGKQSDQRGGIWYTPQSGIWQSVWLEFMPDCYIRDLKITPNGIEKTVLIEAGSGGAAQEITVYDGDAVILTERFADRVTLTYDFTLWSPENPKLYDFVITNEAGDRLHSYFGVRSFGMAPDGTGKMRLTLNGHPYFFNGLLDQGYWSDGLLTYPSDEAAVDELTLMKEMGFNTLRKHIKVEPMRWYYHCDRLGLVVWQDFVNGGGDYKFTHVAAFPFLGFHHRDDDYTYFAREDAEGRARFEEAAEDTVKQLYNTVSVGLWVPFNEGWGQFDSARITELVQGWDPTRIIDSVSGWHDQGIGKTRLRSLHTYYTPLKVPKDPRPVVLSEFGGYSMQTPGHVFDPSKEFGYKKFKTQTALVAALEKLYLKKLLPLIGQGLSAAIYTQVSDVEEEINGLVTYDRAVVKVPVTAMRRLNDALMSEAEKIQ